MDALITLKDRVQELVKETVIDPEKLDKYISDDHLFKVALFLTSWRTVAPYLGLSVKTLDAIVRKCKNEQEKRLIALQEWKSKFGFKATYRKLVEVLLSLAMADVAEKVCHLLKGMYIVMVMLHIIKSKV